MASLWFILPPALVFMQLFLLPHVSHLMWKANTPFSSDFAKPDWVLQVCSPFLSVLFLSSSRSLLWGVQELHTVFYMWSHLLCVISIHLISFLEILCQHNLELHMAFSCLNHTASSQTSCDSSITQARCLGYFPINLHLISKSSRFLFSKSACPFIFY